MWKNECGSINSNSQANLLYLIHQSNSDSKTKTFSKHYEYAVFDKGTPINHGLKIKS